jgi:hypothetical protein
MPRVSVCTNLDDEKKKGFRFSAENDNTDFCKRCYRHLKAEDIAESNGVSLEAVDMGADHPFYADDDYTCHCCGCKLREGDE